MTICPVALAVGCRKCPVFAICPVKSVIGDQPKDGPASTYKSKKSAGKSQGGR